MGCTSMIVIAIVGVAVLLGAIWWGCSEVVNRFTSSQSEAVQTVTTDAEFAAAEQKLNAVQEASRTHQSATVEFTAAELNALIARHPDFSDMRGKFRVAMEKSIMTLDMSVPLSAIELPKIRHRWLNGTARFGLIYHEGNFSFSLRALRANDHDLSIKFMKGFAAAFNEKFNEGFNKTLNKDERANDFWQTVKTLAVIEDKLVVTTTGREALDDEKAPGVPEPTATPGM